MLLLPDQILKETGKNNYVKPYNNTQKNLQNQTPCSQKIHMIEKNKLSHGQLLFLGPNESTLALLSICVFILPLTCFFQKFTSVSSGRSLVHFLFTQPYETIYSFYFIVSTSLIIFSSEIKFSLKEGIHFHSQTLKL